MMRGMLSVNRNSIDVVQYSNEAHIEALGAMGSDWQRFSKGNLEEACDVRLNNVSRDQDMVTHREPVLS